MKPNISSKTQEVFNKGLIIIKEILNSDPKIFTFTTMYILKQTENQDKQINRISLSQMYNNNKNKPDKIPKMFFDPCYIIQDQDTNNFTFFGISILERQHLDLISFIANFIMSRADNIHFTLTSSGITSLYKLKQKIYIKNSTYTLSELIAQQLQNQSSNNERQIDFQIILLVKYDLIQSFSIQNVDKEIQNKFLSSYQLIQSLGDKIQQLLNLKQEELQAKLQDGLIKLLEIFK